MINHHLPTELVRPADPLLAGSLNAAACAGGRAGLLDVLRREIRELRFGHSAYRLRMPLVLHFYPRIDGPNGKLMTSPALHSLVGHGATFDAAWQDWLEQFHVRIQSLMAMRPWEMQSPDLESWEKIEQMIDVAAYRRETPRRVRQIGVISQARRSATRGHSPQFGPFRRTCALPNQVEWESGRTEEIDLSSAVPDFAALRVGQRFEAVVMRDPTTDRLLGIVDVITLPALPDAASAKTLLESVPTSKALEPINWERYD
ncbi:MAG TPA: hypothetical protein VFE62_06850 [Gemmataceae bacterium]|nr:hypothetical protein [Gemmataceae bacterium]